jgi:glycosyltransferase involved in cell wall biosynthesis
MDQSFQDFEIVIINDCSTDKTFHFLTSIKDKRIRSINLPINQGGNYARNAGVQESKGRFLAFCDDDDIWMPKKIERQIEIMQSCNIDLCYAGVNSYTNRDKFIRYTFHRPRYNNLHKAIMDDNFIGTISSVVVTKSMLTSIGGFDQSLPALQDWDLFIKLIKNNCRVLGIDSPLVKYFIVNEKRSISCNVYKFKTATNLLYNKFENDPYINLLNRRLKIIFLKRLLKSRQFLFDSIRYYFRRWTF